MEILKQHTLLFVNSTHFYQKCLFILLHTKYNSQLPTAVKRVCGISQQTVCDAQRFFTINMRCVATSSQLCAEVLHKRQTQINSIYTVAIGYTKQILNHIKLHSYIAKPCDLLVLHRENKCWSHTEKYSTVLPTMESLAYSPAQCKWFKNKISKDHVALLRVAHLTLHCQVKVSTI